MTEDITDSTASASSSPTLNNNEEDATHDEQKCHSTPTTSPSSTHQIRIKTGGSTASAFADMQMNNKTVDDADVMDMLLPWDNYTSINNKAPPRRRKKNGGLKKNTGGGLANSRRQSDPSFDHIFLEEGNAMTSGKNNPIR